MLISRCGTPRGTTIKSPGPRRVEPIAKRVLDFAIEDVHHLFAVRMDVFHVALAGIEHGEAHREFGARRVAFAHGPVHAAEAGGIGSGADIAPDLIVDERHVQCVFLSGSHDFIR